MAGAATVHQPHSPDTGDSRATGGLWATETVSSFMLSLYPSCFVHVLDENRITLVLKRPRTAVERKLENTRPKHLVAESRLESYGRVQTQQERQGPGLPPPTLSGGPLGGVAWQAPPRPRQPIPTRLVTMEALARHRSLQVGHPVHTRAHSCEGGIQDECSQPGRPAADWGP